MAAVVALRSRLRRRFRRAFVLSGGGNLGALQVGMLRALVELGIEPDVVLGCSVGAINGAAFAVQPGVAGVERLEEFWTRPDGAEVMPGSRLPPIVSMLRRGEALHSGEGLRIRLGELFGAGATFEDAVVPFQCVAADVDSAVETWFDEGPLVPPVTASAAMPAVFPVVEIEGRRYLDGGAVNNVPISRAVELGCREIVVLHVGLHGRPDATIRRPLDAALQAYWVARNARFANDLANLPDGVEAIILPPGERPDLRFDDFTQSAELIRRGYRNALRFLERRTAELEAHPGPVDRLRSGIRQRTWIQEVRRAVVDPEGAVVRGDRGEDPSATGADESGRPVEGSG
jgi:NTE family protein